MWGCVHLCIYLCDKLRAFGFHFTEHDMQSWDLSESPPSALLIQTPQTPSPSPQCSQDPLVSDLCEETVIDIKLAIFHLLMLARNEFLQETCYGCEAGHPSQVQHSCLQELPEYFFVFLSPVCTLIHHRWDWNTNPQGCRTHHVWTEIRATYSMRH